VTGKIRETKKIKNRQTILNSAINQFKTCGFANTSVADIMAKSNLGVGTFYNYFNSKEEVLMSIVRELFTEVENRVKLMAQKNFSTLELLEFCAMSTARLVDENRFILPLMANAVKHSDKPEQLPKNLSPVFKKIFEEIIERGQKLGEIRNDIPKNLISEMFHSIYQAAAFSKLQIPFTENIRLKLKILLDGIKI
jgi:AcrR family transcriptional regulator